MLVQPSADQYLDITAELPLLATKASWPLLLGKLLASQIKLTTVLSRFRYTQRSRRSTMLRFCLPRPPRTSRRTASARDGSPRPLQTLETEERIPR